ncbi:MAG: hypothetical protein GWP04_04375 [Gammaproteobacteria bacterium]|nr:hypothetical protein [Gammaproteobacteria bacterium]
MSANQSVTWMTVEDRHIAPRRHSLNALLSDLGSSSEMTGLARSSRYPCHPPAAKRSHPTDWRTALLGGAEGEVP